MKPQTEKPSEQVMRFFTPELYLRFNSENDREADAASEAWDAAIVDYQKHLDAIRDKMPSQVRRLSELCLHDAEFLAFHQEIEPIFPSLPEPFGPCPYWSALGILSLRQEGRLVSLIYLLWDKMRERDAKANWPFSKARKHWLFDEIDVSPNHRGMFLHRILFSDGRTIEIPFVSVFTHELQMLFSDPPAPRRAAAASSF